jgi:hypothetical protein
MATKKQVGIPVAILTIIAGVAGGSYAFDFSSTETTIGDTTETNIGDTITTNINQLREDAVKEATLVAICSQDVVPEEYVNTCKERESP